MSDEKKRLPEDVDTVSIPGGYYIGADGVPHDAHGNPIVEGGPSGGDSTPSGPKASAAAIELAEANGIDLQVLQGSGAEGAIKVDDVRAAIEAKSQDDGDGEDEE